MEMDCLAKVKQYIELKYISGYVICNDNLLNPSDIIIIILGFIILIFSSIILFTSELI